MDPDPFDEGEYTCLPDYIRPYMISTDLSSDESMGEALVHDSLVIETPPEVRKVNRAACCGEDCNPHQRLFYCGSVTSYTTIVGALYVLSLMMLSSQLTQVTGLVSSTGIDLAL